MDLPARRFLQKEELGIRELFSRYFLQKSMILIPSKKCKEVFWLILSAICFP